MAKFFVGQRVRIKWSRFHKELEGTAGRIIECGNFRCLTSGVTADFVVHADLWGSEISPYRGTRFTPQAVQLDPITPEGQQPCGESYEQLMGRLRSGVVA